MYATNILANRVGCSSSSTLSSSCRGCLSRSYSSSSSSSSTTSTTTATTTRQQRSRSSSNNNNNNNAAASPLLVTSTAAGAACILCHSLRMTATCSASTMAATATTTTTATTKTKTQPLNHMRQFYSSATSSYDALSGIRIKSSLLLGSANYSTTTTTTFTDTAIPTTRSFAYAAARNNKLSSAPSPLPNQQHLHYRANEFHSSSTTLLSTRDISLMMSYLGARQLIVLQGGTTSEAPRATTTAAITSDSAWTFSELTGAILFAGAATAGGMLLGGPMEGLRGKTTCGGGGGGGGGGSGGVGSNGGGGGGSGGGGNGPGGNIGGPAAGESHKPSLESSTKKKESQAKELDVIHTAIVPRSYEVSVRALRGGRLSMEDEFVVVSGGRLAAVFDGHGGGGVSQYLRDRLHVIISEHLHQQELSQKTKLRGGDIKRFVFGNGHSKKHALSEGDQDLEDGASATSANSPNYSVSHVGKLPITSVVAALKDSFDQVEKEILRHDEYEYQGSTAVATLLHEASDGTRTLISANIGDSRGILSRNGTAIDLTRDHKPNDDKEKARILAMGEKIEWDHYCKVFRVRNLSLSRAIGDRFAKPAVSGEVEIKCFPVYDDNDEFILLASDGLWDVMSSQEVVSYVHKRLNAPPKDGIDVTCERDMTSLKSLRRKNLSRFIANEALRRGSGDNISVVIVWLNTT